MLDQRERRMGVGGSASLPPIHPCGWGRASTSLKAASSPEVWLERPKRFSTVEMELLR